MDHHSHHMSLPDDAFPQDAAGLPDAVTPQVVRQADNDILPLHIGPVRKQIGGHCVRMLAYNASVPGPLLRVRQSSEITVEVSNDADLEQTVHWHGLRLDNRFDGVPYETQKPIPVGGRFTYRLQFPDAGLYWYHPHVREDYSQEMGLYGQIIVRTRRPPRTRTGQGPRLRRRDGHERHRSNMTWKIVDTATHAVNDAIRWTFQVGDRIKIRLDNSTGSDHDMHHPFHIHGAGRFLVLARDGMPEPNLMWKTPSSFGPARSSTSSSTSPTPADGWPTATSPNTTRAE